MQLGDEIICPRGWMLRKVIHFVYAPGQKFTDYFSVNLYMHSKLICLECHELGNYARLLFHKYVKYITYLGPAVTV